jgi:hypothetical protein
MWFLVLYDVKCPMQYGISMRVQLRKPPVLYSNFKKASAASQNLGPRAAQSNRLSAVRAPRARPRRNLPSLTLTETIQAAPPRARTRSVRSMRLRSAQPASTVPPPATGTCRWADDLIAASGLLGGPRGVSGTCEAWAATCRRPGPGWAERPSFGEFLTGPWARFGRTPVRGPVVSQRRRRDGREVLRDVSIVRRRTVLLAAA